MRKELGLKRRKRAVEGGNKKRKEKIRACNVVLCCLLYKFYQAVSILLHNFSKAGDSFVLAGEDVTKMHPYP